MLLLLASLTIAHAGLPDLDAPHRTGATAAADVAVVIGLEDYAFVPDVPYARADAQIVRDLLVYTIGVAPDRLTWLTQGGREQIVAAVARAGGQVGENGRVWVYFAGHGAASAEDGERVLLGDDVRPDPTSFAARGLALSELEALATAGGGVPVLLLDTCYNGVGRDGEELLGGTRFAVPSFATTPTSGATWSAAGADELAAPLPSAGHGAFTYVVAGALRGWADGELSGARDGVVDADEASAYVVRALRTVQVHGQTPVWSGATLKGLSRGTEATPELVVGGRTRPSESAPHPPRTWTRSPPALGWLAVQAELGAGWLPGIDADTGALALPMAVGDEVSSDRDVQTQDIGGVSGGLALAIRAHEYVEVGVRGGARSSVVAHDVFCDGTSGEGGGGYMVKGCANAMRTDVVPFGAVALRGRLPPWPRLQLELGLGAQRVNGVDAVEQEITLSNEDDDEPLEGLAPGESVTGTLVVPAVPSRVLPLASVGVGIDLVWARPFGLYAGGSLEWEPGHDERIIGDDTFRTDSGSSSGGAGTPKYALLSLAVRWSPFAER